MTKSVNDLLVGGQIVMNYGAGGGGGDAGAKENTVPAQGSDAHRIPDVLALADLLTGLPVDGDSHSSGAGEAIRGGFLRIEAVDATTARVVLEAEGSDSGNTLIPIVTLENLAIGFDSASVLSSLLREEDLK